MGKSLVSCFLTQGVFVFDMDGECKFIKKETL